MDPTAKRRLGRTDLHVTQMGFGTAGLGGQVKGQTEEQAVATLNAAWDGGMRLFDTAPWYGVGLSELRTGQGLYGRERDSFVLSTKVGRRLMPGRRGRIPWRNAMPFHVRFDYSYDGVMRAYEDSLQRLRVDRIDVLLIHDIDLGYHSPPERLDARFAELVTGGYEALDKLRASGAVGAIGGGVNVAETVSRHLDLFDLDVFLVAAPYTLLHQDVLDDVLPRCQERGVGIIIGAPFQSGLLVTGLTDDARYNYGQVPLEIVERVRAIERVCAEHGVPLPAAALQFPLGHPSVATVIPGAFAPEQVAENLAAFRHDIPEGFWAELKAERLIREDAPTPSAAGG